MSLPEMTRVQDLDPWLSRARQLGAVAGQALVIERSGLSAEVVHGRITRVVPHAERTVRITVWVEGGGHATVEGPLETVTDLVPTAVAAAGDAPTDPAAGPARRVKSADYRRLGVDDLRFPALGERDRLEVALAAERGARAVDTRIHTDAFQWSDERVHRVFANTQDLKGEEWATTYRCDGGVRVADDDALVALSDGLTSRTFATLSSLPFGASMARRALALLTRRVSVSGPTRVMLEPRATATLFAALAEALVSPGGAPFLTKQTRLDPRVHLLDDGQLPGGLRAHAFDDDGVPPVPVVLLRAGRLDQSYVTPADARAASTRPTGHHFGGVLRPANLVLRGGTRSMNAILSERSDVDAFQVSDAVIQDVDWTTGQIELHAYGALRSGNTISGYVPGVRLRGALTDLLSQVVDLSSDTDRVDNIDAPGLLVDGFVAG